MDFEKIVNVRLSDEQKSYCLDRIHQINKLLRKWAEIHPKLSNRQVRTLILDFKRTHLLEIPESRKEEFLADLLVIRAVRESDPQLDNRSIEFAILQNYSNLADKFARMWSRKHEVNRLDYADLLQECYLQVTEAMYGWFNDRGSDLTTFIWWSLKNRLSNVINQQGSDLSHLTNRDIKLLSELKKKTQLNPTTSIDENVDSMKLSPDEVNNLMNALLGSRVQIQDIRSILSCEADSKSRKATVFFNRSTSEDEDQEFVDNIIDRSGLTNFERELIQHAMNPFYGWQTQLGTRICPITNKPYGRQRISQILKNARQKLAMAYHQATR